MRSLRRAVLPLAVLSVLAACAVEPGEENLKTSFVEQIEGVSSVEGLEREGDSIRFTERRADGDDVSWRVTIDFALIEPIGTMSRLPDAFLEAGVAQECYALWDENAGAWDW